MACVRAHSYPAILYCLPGFGSSLSPENLLPSLFRQPPKRKFKSPTTTGRGKGKKAPPQKKRNPQEEEQDDVTAGEEMLLLQKEKSKEAFLLFDEAGKGCVVLEDLQRISQELGENYTDEELEEMMVFADKKGDGLLRPKDFARIARQANLK